MRIGNGTWFGLWWLAILAVVVGTWMTANWRASRVSRGIGGGLFLAGVWMILYLLPRI